MDGGLSQNQKPERAFPRFRALFIVQGQLLIGAVGERWSLIWCDNDIHVSVAQCSDEGFWGIRVRNHHVNIINAREAD